MTQRRDNQTLLRLLNQRTLLAGGLSCLSGLGILSTGMVVAQTSDGTAPLPPDSLSSETLVVPSAQDLLQPTLQETPVEPAIVSPAPEPDVAIPDTVEHQGTAPTATEPGTEAAAPEDPAAPSTSVSDLVAPNLVEKAANLGLDPTIDPTPYDIGATASPNSIVVSERSTGCQTVLQQGQAVPGSICPASAAGTAMTSAGDYTTVSVGPLNLSGGGISLGRVTPVGGTYYNLTMRPPALLGNGNIKLMFPLSIPAAITSVFGWRVHPIAGETRFHSGTDLGAPQGTPVLAAFSGKVEIADFLGGYGLTVVLDHNKSTQQTLYGHLSEIFVKPGETIKQGEVIGRVGSTGFSTGPHLHFEFRQLTSDGWVALDPGQTLEYSLAEMIRTLNGKGSLALANQPIDPLQRLKQILKITAEKKAEAQAKKSEKQAAIGQ